jgi:rubredoxin
MASHARKRENVGLQSRAARGIAAGEGEHDRRSRGHELIFRGHSTAALFSPIRMTTENQVQFKTWMCLICGWVYDEAAGLPEEGIAPGTRWEDVPMNWTCPECGARKDDFEMVEI